MKYAILPLSLFLNLLLSPLATSEIVSSIRPVDLIVKEIARNQLASSSLLDGSVSPHDYSMKLSDAQKLKQAATFIWIGPGMEGFLTKAIDRFVVQDNEVRLSNSFGPPAHHHHKGHDHDDSQHLWLSYNNAARMAEDIVAHLVLKHPDLADEIRQNLERFKQNLEQEKASTEMAFAEHNDKAFFAYHDAYQSYVQEFDLGQLDSAKVVPESQLSLKRMIQLKRTSSSAACVLANDEELPQAQAFADKLELPVFGVDLLAAAHETHGESYDFFDYMKGIREAFLACFNAG